MHGKRRARGRLPAEKNSADGNFALWAWRVRTFMHVGRPYVQRLSTRYLGLPRRAIPRAPALRPLWSLGPFARLRFAREGTYAAAYAAPDEENGSNCGPSILPVGTKSLW